MPLQAKDGQRLPANWQRLDQACDRLGFSVTAEGTSPADVLISDFSLQNHEALSRPVCGSLPRQPQQRRTGAAFHQSHLKQRRGGGTGFWRRAGRALTRSRKACHLLRCFSRCHPTQAGPCEPPGGDPTHGSTCLFIHRKPLIKNELNQRNEKYREKGKQPSKTEQYELSPSTPSSTFSSSKTIDNILSNVLEAV